MNINDQIKALRDARRRRRLAYKLRTQKEPKTFQEIGDILGVSRQRAQKMVEAVEKELSGQ